MKIKLDTLHVINVEKRVDRWKKVEHDTKKLCQELDVCIQRFPAIYLPMDTVRGCRLSFQEAVRQAKNRNDEYVCICQDDLYVIDVNKVKQALENAPDDWDILLGGVYYFIPKQRYNEHWYQLNDFCALHFTIIHSRYYDNILNTGNSSKHLDRQLGMDLKKTHGKVFVMHPMPIKQRRGFSDLQNRVVDYNHINLPWIKHVLN